jgi:hypothetical protein
MLKDRPEVSLPVPGHAIRLSLLAGVIAAGLVCAAAAALAAAALAAGVLL